MIQLFGLWKFKNERRAGRCSKKYKCQLIKYVCKQISKISWKSLRKIRRISKRIPAESISILNVY